MTRGADDTHLDAALNRALLEWWALKLDTLFRKGGGEEAPEADAAAAATTRPHAATPPADVAVARHVVLRWRAFVAARKACPLLDLIKRHPDLFEKEVLERLDPTDRSFLGQVDSSCRAAVVASDLPCAGPRVGMRQRTPRTAPGSLGRYGGMLPTWSITPHSGGHVP